MSSKESDLFKECALPARHSMARCPPGGGSVEELPRPPRQPADRVGRGSRAPARFEEDRWGRERQRDRVKEKQSDRDHIRKSGTKHDSPAQFRQARLRAPPPSQATGRSLPASHGRRPYAGLRGHGRRRHRPRIRGFPESVHAFVWAVTMKVCTSSEGWKDRGRGRDREVGRGS